MNTEYAIKDGVLTHVSEVERGLKCSCVCPSCGANMIARKGNKMAHHFAHQNAECSHGLETTLHLMAKEILEQEKRILLPLVFLPLEYTNKLLTPECTMLEIDDVTIEKRLGDIIPDIIIKSGGKQLMVEIWVTHKIDDNKLRKIKELDISTIEINLSKLDRMISMNELREFLLKDEEHKFWVYNSLAEYYKQMWLSVCEVKPIFTRNYAVHVDDCPIRARVWRGQPYANVTDDCSGCEYNITIIRNRTNEEEDDDEFLYCSGRIKVKSVSELKTYLSKAVKK